MNNSAFIEEDPIPDDHILYYRVHKGLIGSDDVVSLKAFKEQGEGDAKGMSTNWSKYATAQLTKEQAADNGKLPEDYGIVSFIVGELKTIKLKVKHKPLPNNQSHTNVNGLPDSMKDTEIRLNLRKIYKWKIKYVAPQPPQLLLP